MAMTTKAPRDLSRSGPITAVPCPWCRKKNDLTLLPQEIGQETYKKTAFTISCVHCDENYIIQRVQLSVTVARYKEPENNG